MLTPSGIRIDMPQAADRKYLLSVRRVRELPRIRLLETGGNAEGCGFNSPLCASYIICLASKKSSGENSYIHLSTEFRECIISSIRFFQIGPFGRLRKLIKRVNEEKRVKSNRGFSFLMNTRKDRKSNRFNENEISIFIHRVSYKYFQFTRFFLYLQKKKKRNNSIVFLTNSSKPVSRLRYSLDKEKILIPLVIIPINPVIIHRL